LDTNFHIIDENDAQSIIQEIARLWLHSHPDELDEYLDPELESDKTSWVLNEKLPELVKDIAVDVIRFAKDLRLTPAHLHAMIDQLQVPLPLAEMGVSLYEEYEQALAYRGAVDFDDLVRLALTVLEADPNLLDRLRHRWPYILEDEAQDSSHLQEDILTLLTNEMGNWVRVGDPNQAIYETFTTASPRHLRAFMRQTDVHEEELPDSGRSSLSIIELANFLVDWTVREHPIEAVRDALHAPPKIQPAPPGDPQQNPPDDPRLVILYDQKADPRTEIRNIVDSLARWLPGNHDATVAVLTANNHHAIELVEALKRKDLPYNDSLLRSSSATRSSAGILGDLLKYLADPQSSIKLAKALEAWVKSTHSEEAGIEQITAKSAELIRKCLHVENYIWPGPEVDWLVQLNIDQEQPEVYQQLLDFRELVRRWQNSVILPIDQLVLTLAQDLYHEIHELALIHKIATLLKQTSQLNPTWRLPDWSRELALIASNERRFIGFSEDDAGFDPSRYRGTVVVSTLHKSKGLEWDRVYILSVNNYDFPSGQAHDTYISEKWFIRDRLNLQAETLAQIKLLTSPPETGWYEESRATREARLEYVRERLRLLYVGITRAKKELVITWNSGRFGDTQAAAPFLALHQYWYSRTAHER